MDVSPRYHAGPIQISREKTDLDPRTASVPATHPSNIGSEEVESEEGQEQDLLSDFVIMETVTQGTVSNGCVTNGKSIPFRIHFPK